MSGWPLCDPIPFGSKQAPGPVVIAERASVLVEEGGGRVTGVPHLDGEGRPAFADTGGNTRGTLRCDPTLIPKGCGAVIKR